MKETRFSQKISLLVALTLLTLGLAACNAQTSTNSNSSSSQTAQTTETTSTYFTKRDQDASYDEASAGKITLSGTNATSSAQGVAITNSTVTITQAGTYILSGNSENVQIIIKANDQDKVQLVLNGVTMKGTDAAIVVENADKTFITLAENSQNTIADAANHQNTDYDAAIYSKDDLTFNGTGQLTVEGNYGNAIESNDDLRITGGTYTIKGYKNALSANDALNIKDATLNLTATEDALHADNDEDTSLGNLYIQSGNITISAGDDGIHASNTALIDGGEITVTSSVEALEGKNITINGGNLNLTASDDGINAADGTTSNVPDQAISDVNLNITGGVVHVNAEGDGLDSNGNLTISGGEVYIDGPTTSGNGALDYDGEGSITGGKVIMTGSAGMAMGFGSNSSQASILANTTGKAGDVITIRDTSGKQLLQYTTTKDFQSLLASSSDLKANESYTITINNQSSTVTASLAQQNGMMGGGPGGRR